MSTVRRALGLLAAAVLVGVASVAWAQDGGRHLEIAMSEYKFEPGQLTLRAGETVTITVVNNSSQDREHELMVGREVEMGGPFGDQPEGYHEDFFQGVEVELLSGEGIAMVMAGEATLKDQMAGMGAGGMGTGMGMGMDMPMGEEGAHGFMIQLKPGGKATFRFTVPSGKAGRWEIGCFAEDGQHYDEGMRAALLVNR